MDGINQISFKKINTQQNNNINKQSGKSYLLNQPIQDTHTFATKQSVKKDEKSNALKWALGIGSVIVAAGVAVFALTRDKGATKVERELEKKGSGILDDTKDKTKENVENLIKDIQNKFKTIFGEDVDSEFAEKFANSEIEKINNNERLNIIYNLDLLSDKALNANDYEFAENCLKYRITAEPDSCYVNDKIDKLDELYSNKSANFKHKEWHADFKLGITQKKLKEIGVDIDKDAVKVLEYQVRLHNTGIDTGLDKKGRKINLSNDYIDKDNLYNMFNEIQRTNKSIYSKTKIDTKTPEFTEQCLRGKLQSIVFPEEKFGYLDKQKLADANKKYNDTLNEIEQLYKNNADANFKHKDEYTAIIDERKVKLEAETAQKVKKEINDSRATIAKAYSNAMGKPELAKIIESLDDKVIAQLLEKSKNSNDDRLKDLISFTEMNWDLKAYHTDTSAKIFMKDAFADMAKETNDPIKKELYSYISFKNEDNFCARLDYYSLKKFEKVYAENPTVEGFKYKQQFENDMANAVKGTLGNDLNISMNIKRSVVDKMFEKGGGGYANDFMNIPSKSNFIANSLLQIAKEFENKNDLSNAEKCFKEAYNLMSSKGKFFKANEALEELDNLYKNNNSYKSQLKTDLSLMQTKTSKEIKKAESAINNLFNAKSFDELQKEITSSDFYKKLLNNEARSIFKKETGKTFKDFKQISGEEKSKYLKLAKANLENQKPAELIEDILSSNYGKATDDNNMIINAIAYLNKARVNPSDVREVEKSKNLNLYLLNHLRISYKSGKEFTKAELIDRKLDKEIGAILDDNFKKSGNAPNLIGNTGSGITKIDSSENNKFELTPEIKNSIIKNVKNSNNLLNPAEILPRAVLNTTYEYIQTACSHYCNDATKMEILSQIEQLSQKAIEMCDNLGFDKYYYLRHDLENMLKGVKDLKNNVNKGDFNKKPTDKYTPAEALKKLSEYAKESGVEIENDLNKYTDDISAIKKVYKNLSKKFHPDVNQSNPDIVEKFTDVGNIYSVLDRFYSEK